MRYLSHLSAFAGVIFLLTILVCVFNGGGLGSGDLRELTPWIAVLCVAFFATFPVTVMKPFKSRDTLVMENTLPASITEKWLFVFLNTTVAAFVMLFAAFAVTVLTGMAISGTSPFVDYYNSYNMGSLVHFTIMIQAIVMYAGTMERRNHILSALLAGAAWLAAFFMLCIFPMWLSDKLDGRMDWGPMFTFSISSAYAPGAEIRYERFFDIEPLLNYLCAVSTLLFWVASWFNFRQRSIK